MLNKNDNNQPINQNDYFYLEIDFIYKVAARNKPQDFARFVSLLVARSLPPTL